MMKIKHSSEDKIFNIHTEGIPYLSLKMLDDLGVPNLFSTRYLSYDEAAGRGESGLRTAIMKGEDMGEAAPVVYETRGRLAGQIGSSIEFECISDQKHTNYVIEATKDDLGPVWPNPMPTHRRYVDGLITNVPDALLTIFGGDCPPVYIVDPVRDAIGLVHAGWKGTLGKISAVAIAQMTINYGSKPSDMYAAIGPGICKDCYEVGDEVYGAFANEWGKGEADKILSLYPATDEEGREIPRGKYHLDIREANKMTLLEAGVPEDHIAVSNVCTMCNVDAFYSYRAGKMENEQVAMLVNRFEDKL